MDIIFVRDLEIETVIGIWEWERHTTQIVRLDLEMATDASRAARVDRIDEALNYKDVAKRIEEFVGGSKFELVESLAEAVARIVITEFGVPWARVSVAKPGALKRSKEVGVIIERRADAYG